MESRPKENFGGSAKVGGIWGENDQEGAPQAHIDAARGRTEARKQEEEAGWVDREGVPVGSGKTHLVGQGTHPQYQTPAAINLLDGRLWCVAVFPGGISEGMCLLEEED